MATGPIETHLHHSFNWENAAPGSRMGPRGRSANCGNGLFAQCVRLRSEINRSEFRILDNMSTCIAPQFRNVKTSRVSKPRGSSRRCCSSGVRSRRSPSLARGMSPIFGRVCSCWTSRGGCSASKGSEHHTGVSRDGARIAVHAYVVEYAEAVRCVLCGKKQNSTSRVLI